MWFLTQKDILLTFYILIYAFGVNILQFSDNERAEGAARIKNDLITAKPSSFVLCMDFELKLVEQTRLLWTVGHDDLQIVVWKSLDRLFTKLKGTWYLSPARLSPYTWGTYCVSYDSEQHRVIFAYNGHIIFEKIDPNLLGVSEFSDGFPGNIELGAKAKAKSFTGDITRLNMWSKSMSANELKIKSSCDGLENNIVVVGDPDLIDWEMIEWDIPDGSRIKEITAYPCNSNQTDLFDVLMPYTAEHFYDAFDTCTVLGGRMAVPDSEEKLKRMFAEVKRDYGKFDCVEYLWIPFHFNTEGNWALYDGTKKSLLPEFFKEPPWLEWEKGQPNGLGMEECVKASIEDNPLLFDADCHVPRYCFLCEFEDITNFNIRGLCSNLEKILDIKYLVDMDRVKQYIDKGVIWTGYLQSRIVFNKTLERWTITSLFDSLPILTLATKVVS